MARRGRHWYDGKYVDAQRDVRRRWKAVRLGPSGGGSSERADAEDMTVDEAIQRNGARQGAADGSCSCRRGYRHSDSCS